MEYYAVVEKSDDHYILTGNDFQEVMLIDKSRMQNNIYSMLVFM